MPSRRKRRRDPPPRSVVPRGGPDPRTLAQFRRETAALLTHGHRFSRTMAVSSVRKWDVLVRKLWAAGKPPCLAADKLARLTTEGSRKHASDRTTKRRSRVRGQRSRRPRSRRDADHPRKGEVYSSRYGNRWKVVDVPEDSSKLTVERMSRPAGEKLLWGKASLRGMRLVEGGKEESRQLSLFGSDRPSLRNMKKRRGVKGRLRCRSSVVTQSLVFSRVVGWTLAKAKAWARSHGFKHSKVDVTPTQVRFRQVPPSRVRVIGSKEVRRGVRLILGCPR